MTTKKEEDNGLRPYYYYEQQIYQRLHHFYISGEIIQPGYYVDMIHRIKTASPDEMIYIHLNTPGGQLNTGIQLINAIQVSQAHIICSVEAESHSLGTLIFLAADEFIVHDNTLMMFHSFSGATFGKGHEQHKKLQADMKWFNSLAKSLYIPFIDEAEFDRIERGEDLYFHAPEIRTRLENMVSILEKQQKKEAQTKTKTRKSRKHPTPQP